MVTLVTLASPFRLRAVIDFVFSMLDLYTSDKVI